MILKRINPLRDQVKKQHCIPLQPSNVIFYTPAILTNEETAPTEKKYAITVIAYK